MTWFRLWIFCFILCAKVHLSLCKGKISINLLEYHNPSGKDASGKCCDGVTIPGCGLGVCDHLFRVCLLDQLSQSPKCLQPTDIATIDKNVVIFEPNQQEVQFTFETWKGEADILVEVFDSNSEDKNIFIDNFTVSYNQTKAGYNQTTGSRKTYDLTGTRNSDPTSLKLSVSAFCDTSYYGTDCSVKCVATNKCDGHYSCDSQGNKLCLQGWRGSECTEQIPGSSADCSVYTDKNEFVPSSWEGLYTCDKGQHRYPLYLNVTKPQNTIKLAAELSFGNVSIHLNGSYLPFAKALGLEVNGNITFGSLELTQVTLQVSELNSTNMFGQLDLTHTKGKLSCIVDPLALKKAYFDGCDFKGTCVRYGIRKDQYYCCCNDGSIGTSCSSTTPTASTTQMTTKPTTLPTTPSTTTRTTTPQATTEKPTSPELTTQAAMTPNPTPKPTTKPTTTLSPTTPTPKPTTRPSTQPTTKTTVQTTVDQTTKPSTPPTTRSTTMPSTNPTTIKPTSQLTTKATTQRPTTSTPTLTTEAETTVEVTTPEETTTRSEAPTTKILTTKSTTKTTTIQKTTASTKATTLPITKATTTMASSTTRSSTMSPIFSGDKTFQLLLLAVNPEINAEDIFSVIKKSWISENKGVVSLRSDDLKIDYKEHANCVINWEPVFLMRYQMLVNSSIPNLQSIRQPSDMTIIDQLKLYYGTNKTLLYTDKGTAYNLDFSLQFYVHGPAPNDRDLKLWEHVILGALNQTCDTNGKCYVDDETKVIVRMREEYVGDDGIEITEISYFIEYMGVTVLPTNFTGITTKDYVEAFQAAGITTKIYQGLKKQRFRFHFTLYVVGKVRFEDINDFEIALTIAWNTTYPQVYSLCNDCKAWLFRKEAFITDDGKQVTGLQYFHYFHGLIEPSFNHIPPNMASMSSLVQVTDVNNLTYSLYNDDTYHRYKYRYSLFIEGFYDPADVQALEDNLKVAVRNYTNDNQINFDMMRTPQILLDDNGIYVTELAFSLTRNNKVLDARIADLPSSEWLHDWFIKQKVIKKSDKPYVVYTGGKNLYTEGQVWAYYMEDFTQIMDNDDIEKILVDAWNITFNAMNVDVKIIKTELLMEKKTRKILTRIHYILMVNGEIQDQDLVDKSAENTTILFSMYRLKKELSYTTYVWNDQTENNVVRFSWMFDLYFTSELSALDLQRNFSSQLYSALQTSWKQDFHSSLEVTIAFQEKVYIGSNHSHAWRVVFYLTKSHNNHTIVINPDFVSPLTETLLYQTLPWVGVGGQTYRLYTQYRIGMTFYRNQHFNLLLTRQVSKLDFTKIQIQLQGLWCKYLGCKDNNNVKITFTEQEKYVDINGNLYWNLVYFVHYKNTIIDSRQYHGISLPKDMLKWLNIYKGHYEVVVNWPQDLWKYSHGFHLYTDQSVTVHLELLKSALVKAWYKMGIVSESCRCLHVEVAHQRPITDLSGNIFWELTYFIWYKRQLVHSTTWPSINTGFIDISSQKSFSILKNINAKLYANLLTFYSNYKLSSTQTTTVEREITNKFLEQNTEYKICRCVSVKIVSQEQVINTNGEVSWKINYQIVKAKTAINPSTLHPIDWSTFQINLTNIYGKAYHFSWSWLDWWNYIYYSFLGRLYVKNWVPVTDYQRFYSALWSYYREYYKGKSVTLEGLNRTEEYFTSTGEKSWRLPFILKIDGNRVNPPSLNVTKFESMLNFTSTSGQSYRLVSGSHTIDASHVLSVDLSHKVATTDQTGIKSAIISAWCSERPDVDPFSVTVDVIGQEELVDQVTGKSTWKLLYSLSVNGTKVDRETSIPLSNSHLSSHLNFTSATGVRYSTVDTKKSYTASSVHGLYFKNYVATTDFTAVSKILKALWEAKLKVMGFGNIDIDFVRQKPFVTATGEQIWHWEYVIKTNSSSHISIPLPEISFTEVGKSFKNVTSTTGTEMAVLKTDKTYANYEKHFSLYLGTKVTTASLAVFEKRIIEAWKSKGVNVTIHHLKQEELVNKVTGKSAWRLVYFLKTSGGEIIDSRTAVKLNTTIFSGISGPRGMYHVFQKKDIKETDWLPYKWSSSVIVDQKFGVTGMEKMKLLLKQIVEEKLHLIEENTVCNQVPVDIQFLLDSSGSVGQKDFVKQINFVARFAELFTIGRDNTQIGVTTFATNYSSQFSMKDHLDKGSLIHAITAIPYKSGGTYTDRALSWARANALTQAAGGRPSATRIVIVMTDGKSQDAIKTKEEAAKLHNDGVQVFAIGIGSGVNKTELNNIASSRENMFTVTSFDALSTIQSKLRQTTCKVFSVNTTVSLKRIKSVDVDIKRQMEYITPTGQTVWKLVYFVKINGKFVPTTSIPGLDIEKLIAKVNITGVNGQKHRVLKVDQSTLLNYRDKFSVFFTGKVTENSLPSIQMALLHTWNTSQEYSSCQCLSIEKLTKNNVEEFVDKDGKSYWRLIYFLKKNDTIIQSMTHSKVDLDIFKQQVKGIINQQNEAYTVVNKTESELYRTKMAFSLFLSTELGFNQTSELQHDLKAAWNLKLKVNNTEIIVNRYMKYIDVTTKKTLWKVEYYMKQNGNVIDPSVTSKLTDLYLTFTNMKGDNYTVLHPTTAVDSRMSYSLFLNREVREKDLAKFTNLIKQYWKAKYNVDVTVEITKSAAILSGERKYWMSSVFIKQGQVFIDSRETQNFNLTKLQTMIDFNGVNNAAYMVHQVKEYKQLDKAFSVYFVNKAVNRIELHSVLLTLQREWQKKVFTSNSSKVEVTLGNQEVSFYGKMSHERINRLTYYLTVNGKEIHPDQVPVVSLEIGETVKKEIYNTESLFHIDFKGLVPRKDINTVGGSLKAAWEASKTSLKQVKLEIISEQEMITSSGGSMWRIWYTVSSNNLTVKSTEEDTISSVAIKSKLNVNRTTDGTPYSQLIDKTATVIQSYEYQDLFTIYFNQKILEKDFIKIEAKLLIVWRKQLGVKVSAVKILSQEETFTEEKRMLWKLLYHVTTTDGSIVNTMFDLSPLFSDLHNTVKVTSPRSEQYLVVDVTNTKTYRFKQAFNVFLNRRIYTTDIAKFHNAVKQTLMKTLTVSSLTDISLNVSIDQKVVSTVTQKSSLLWGYWFIVTANGAMISAGEEATLSKLNLQSHINFTSPRQQKYTIATTIKSFTQYVDMFHIDIEGMVAKKDESHILNNVKSYLQKETIYKSIQLSNTIREEQVVEKTGKSVSRFRFAIESNGSAVLPSLTSPVNYSNLSIPDTQVYTGAAHLYPVDQMYRLNVHQTSSINSTRLQSVLSQVWKDQKKLTTSVKIVAVSQSVGNYGMTLSDIQYTVSTQNTTITPDMEVEPTDKLIGDEIKNQKLSLKVYSSVNYRLRSLYHAMVRYSGEFTVTSKQSIQNVLRQDVAKLIGSSLDHVKTEILLDKDYISSNLSVHVVKLYFKLELNNQTVDSWQKKLGQFQYLLDMKANPVVKQDTNMTQALSPVFALYIKGRVTDNNKLIKSVKTAWSSFTNGKTVSIEIVKKELYVDLSWNIITKVSYAVSIDNMSPDDLDQSQSLLAKLDNQLSGSGMPQCGCSSSKQRKHYVYSKTISTTKVTSAVRTVWINVNSGLSDSVLSVRVKPQSNRKKRAAQPAHKLVDDNGREVTPMEYTVAVQDEEPKPMFVNIPSDNQMKDPLKQAGSEPCLCKPKLAGSLLLDGQTKDAEKPDVADAIKDAFVKENPDVAKPDLDVAVTNIDNNAKSSDGTPVSEVSYRVGLKDRDVEDLNSPSEAHLKKSLKNTAGKTLHSKAQKEEPEDEDWVIPLAIALGVLAALIVIGIIFYCIYKRRHRKREDLIKRENDVKTNNAYDGEHFSDPAAYDNKTYSDITHPDFKKMAY